MNRVRRKNFILQCIPLAGVLAVLLCASSVSGQTLPTAGSETLTVRRSDPATVEVWNRPIVTLRAAIGNREPRDRAIDIRKRIEDLPYTALDDGINIHRSRIGSLEGMAVYSGVNTILGIVPEDLDPESSQTLEQAGEGAAQRLREVLAARLAQRRVTVILRGIGLTIAATIALAVLLWAITKLAMYQIRNIRDDTEHSLTIRNINIRPFFLSLQRALIKLTALGFAVIALYFWLTFVLLQFPYTEPWGHRVGSYLTGLLSELGQGALAALPGLFAVIVIFVLTRVIARAVDMLLRGAEQGSLTLPGLEPETAKATRRLAKILIWIFALTVAYPYIPGSGSDAFKGVSVFVGLMVSLGSAGFVNQVMHGLVVVYSRALKPGDYVRTGDIRGIVSEVGLLSTKIVNRRREEITIPNALMTSNTVVNYTRLIGDQGSVVSTSVTIGYDAPWRQVEAMLIMAAARTPGVRTEPAPRVRQDRLSDFYVEYELLFNIDLPEDRPRILSLVHKQIQDAFNEFGVQIMSPHFFSQPEGKVFSPRAGWHTPPAKESSD